MERLWAGRHGVRFPAEAKEIAHLHNGGWALSAAT